MTTETHYVYIVQCRDGSLYTGWTTHLAERIKVHNSGQGAKYTRSRRPVKLVYHEEYATKSEALKREYAIKRLTRKQKLRLVKNHLCSSSDSYIIEKEICPLKDRKGAQEK